jgi:deoxyxylulose-5-phosphate synthase
MTKNNLLDNVKYPVDLKKLSRKELKQLAKELREELINVVSKLADI